MKIIGLCGAARSGKDTAAEGLVATGWTRMAFADPVREGLLGVDPNVDVTQFFPWFSWSERVIMPLSEAVVRFGWEKLKTLPEVRGLLQRYGTEGGRDIHGYDCWINVLRWRTQTGPLAHRDRFVFTDVRFPNEAAFIKEQGGLVVRIERPAGEGELVGEVAAHSSEHALTPEHWSVTIVNSGSADRLQELMRWVATKIDRRPVGPPAAILPPIERPAGAGS